VLLGIDIAQLYFAFYNLSVFNQWTLVYKYTQTTIFRQADIHQIYSIIFVVIMR